jgi:tRNA1Val (adenine37-N6)-methyltransferase
VPNERQTAGQRIVALPGASVRSAVVARATHDTLFAGRIALAQPARGEGYRVNVDALLLAHFARRPGRGANLAFDLGAGVGAVSLALLYWNAVARVVLVENDPSAAALARENLVTHEWTDRSEVMETDVSRAARELRGEAQLVVCNPPYFAPGRGRAAEVPARGRARSGELGVFVEAARTLLGRRGRACFVYPARELATLLQTLRAHGLEAKRLCSVRATEAEPARVVLVEAMPAKPGGLLIERDWVERDGLGVSAPIARLLAGEVSDIDTNRAVVSRPQDPS